MSKVLGKIKNLEDHNLGASLVSGLVVIRPSDCHNAVPLAPASFQCLQTKRILTEP